MANPLADFTPAEVERAHRYHYPRYVALLLDLVLGFGVATALAFTTAGDWLFDRLGGLPWWGQALTFAAVTLALSALVRLPISFWRGYVHEHRYDFSTQNLAGWLGDRAKALAVGVALTSTLFLGLVGLARAFPGAWPALAAPGAAAVVVLLSFASPVVLEPLFNRFAPLEDEALAAELRGLAEQAGVPVRHVLVADASRRTRKENAYVSGLGRTRRIVLYDTLLRRGRPRELRLIAAHELAHRREQHVAKGTVLGALGAAVLVLVLWALLSWPAALAAVGATGAGDPRIAPFVLLAAGGLELLALPLGSALSRRWERIADRISLELTRDVEAFEAAFRAFARTNLSDLDPPRGLYLVLFTHPTPPERLEAARRWAAERRRDAPGVASVGMASDP